MHVSATSFAEDMQTLPPPDFDGLPLEKYFVPTKILPYLATRGCYWGRCEFCDHGEGYTAGYRSKKFKTCWRRSRTCVTSTGRDIFTLPMSPIHRPFRKLARGLIDSNMGIVWTTHMRFEKSLLEDQVWQDAKDSGCKYLHFGYESGNERVLKLMDKATTTEIMTKHLKYTAEAGIWNHHGVLRLSRRDARGSLVVRTILEQNKDYVHSLGFGTFDLGRHNPGGEASGEVRRDGL